MNKTKVANVTKNFLNRHREQFIAIGVFLILYFVMLTINSCWPLGKNVVVVSDSYEQIGFLFEHFFDALKGKSNLFFTNKLGGGFEILSTLVYMFLNPFYLVNFIAGEANFMKMFTFSVALMFCFNILIFIWFVKSHFKNIGTAKTVIFSLLFCFSGFAAQNYSFLSWQIYPALTLIVVHNFLKMLSDKKILSFSLSLVWFVLTCFGIGIPAVILLFVVFSAYIFFMFDKQSKKEEFVKLFVSFLVAALISVVILFPALLSLMSSSRLTSPLSNLLSVKNKSFLQKISIIFVDAIPILLTAIYFVKCKKTEKINKFLLFALIFLLVPTVFDSTQKMLLGSSYQNFLGRFYFLAEVLIFIISLKFLDEKNFSLSEVKTNVKVKILLLVLFAFAVSGEVVALCFFARRIGITNKAQGFESHFLFYVNFLSFVCIALIFGLIYLLNKKSFLSKKSLKVFALLLVAISLSLNYVSLFVEAKTDDSTRVEAVNLLGETDDCSGVKFFGSNLSNESSNLISSKQNFSVFSSLIDGKTTSFYASLGYFVNDVLVSSSTGNLISDALVGEKFYVCESEQNRPYLKLIKRSENLFLYENLLSTSGVLALDSKFELSPEKTYSQNFEALKTQLGISGELSTSLDGESFAQSETENGYIQYTFTASRDGVLYVNANLLFDFESNMVSNYRVLNSSKNYCTDLAFLKAGETFSFCLKPGFKSINLSSLSFEFLDYEVSSELIQTLQKSEIDLSLSKNGYALSFDAPGKDAPGKFIHIFRPQVKGMTFTLNGNPLSSLNEDVLIFEVGEAGELVATYAYPNKVAWIILGVVCMALVIVVLVIYHFTKFKHVSTALTYAIYGVNCCFIVIFYFFGILLSFIAFSL